MPNRRVTTRLGTNRCSTVDGEPPIGRGRPPPGDGSGTIGCRNVVTARHKNRRNGGGRVEPVDVSISSDPSGDPQQQRATPVASVANLKVSSTSRPVSVAGALAGLVRESRSIEIQVVGAGALNQAIKAVAIARGYVASLGIDLSCRPAFTDITIDGESRTGIRLVIDRHGDGGPPGVGDATEGLRPTG